MEFSEEEKEVLIDMLYDWISEGFQAEPNEIQKQIFDKLEMDYESQF